MRYINGEGLFPFGICVPVFRGKPHFSIILEQNTNVNQLVLTVLHSISIL